MIHVILSPILAFLLTIFSVPLARKAAVQGGIVDRPDGRLKVHHEPVPYLGGLAMYLAFLVTLSVFLEPDQRTLAILIGGTLMVLMGLIDDFGSLSPAVKFAGQLLTVFVLIRSNIMVQVVSFPLWLDIAITFLWVVGLSNAFNIIDIMDGLAAGVAAWSSLALVAVSVINGDYDIAVIAAALLGTCLGFLVYNRHPASIYMGDSGSLFLGMTLGVLGMLGRYSRMNLPAVLTPLLIFAVPIFDTAYVILMRWINGRPVFLGSKDHFAVRMRIAGYPVPRIVTFAVMLQGLAAMSAVTNLFTSARFTVGLYGLWGVVFLVLAVRLAKVPVPSGKTPEPPPENPE